MSRERSGGQRLLDGSGVSAIQGLRPGPEGELARPLSDPAGRLVPMGGERVDGAATYLRQLAWRAAPVAVVEVDPSDGELLVSFFRELPDVAWDPGEQVSVAFRRVAGLHLLTTVCVTGIPDLGDGLVDGTGRANAEIGATGNFISGTLEFIAGTLERLLGESVWRAVQEELGRSTAAGGGERTSRTVALSPEEAGSLLRTWAGFASGGELVEVG